MECGGVQKWMVVFFLALGPGNLAVSFFSGVRGIGEALNGTGYNHTGAECGAPPTLQSGGLRLMQQRQSHQYSWPVP